MKKVKLVLVVLAAVFVVNAVRSSDFGEMPKEEYNVSQTYDNISSNIDAGIDNMDAGAVKEKYWDIGDTFMYILDDVNGKAAKFILKLLNA
ncbi:MAG: hypothetical protein E7272_07460 [Pseudobutyrivibrio ruminis]|uniref:Secreted protein n=1 Tax=Pseudobutyrivibrio ruminis TaxID=46206 RepID=A0A927YQP8_9FIRM|nr:hypothetical protein [Pseudobutyrivibrio ruminis]